MSATSSSDRIEAARQALGHATHQEGINPAECDECGNAWPCPDARVADALRALIEPPATIETPEQIAERIEGGWVAAEIAKNPSGDAPLEPMGDLLALIARGIHAGIQAAWESWEPETANIDDEEGGE